MENYFDIATQEEINTHFSSGINPPSVSFLASMREALEMDSDENITTLASLYASRGDTPTMKKCLALIQSEERRLTANLLLFECQ